MPKYNIVLAPAPDGGIWAYWIPHPMQDAEFHVFHRINFLCEMPRDWSGLFGLEFLNTAVVFIHPISNRSFGFSSGGSWRIGYLHLRTKVGWFFCL